MGEAVQAEHPHIVRIESVCGGEFLIDALIAQEEMAHARFRRS